MLGGFGWIAERLREVNRANVAMRVPELRARSTRAATPVGRVRRRTGTAGGDRSLGVLGRRCVRRRDSAW